MPGIELQKVNEKSLFTDETKAKDQLEPPTGCLRSKHTKNCCIATAAFGGLFLILGVVVMLAAGPYLEKKILKSMALTDGSDRYESWLRPPVQPHLEAFAFHVTNPQAVLAGKKPVLKEVGPFVYKSVTIKDSDENVKWWGDGTLTYRPRKVYSFVPSMSGYKNPDTQYIMIPNIPYWTGMNKASKLSGFKKNMALGLIRDNGLGVPFINVTFSGLLWGYEDELPCLKLDLPGECAAAKGAVSSGFAPETDEDDLFGDGGDDWGDDWGSDDDDDDMGGGFGDEVAEDASEEDLAAKEMMPSEPDDTVDKQFEPAKDSYWEGLVKPKAEFVDCKCNWGLFRDRNITMRKPVRVFTGETDLKMKGLVNKYNGKSTLGWWEKDSKCDDVKGQDSSTLPPGLGKDSALEIYIALMCRTIMLEYEKDVVHSDINTLRFIPPINALGRHDDPNPLMANPDNKCYCLENEGFKCLKSGVMYMEPCKRENMAPVALSMPHFYQADPSFGEAVAGLNPQKEKHQFYMDVVPEFGFPLAIRPRFQLNVVISGDKDVPAIANVAKDLVLPFLWAQDGFDEPSEPMAEAIAFGLAAPQKLPMLGSVVCFVIGAVLLLSSLAYFFWLRRSASHNIKDSS